MKNKLRQSSCFRLTNRFVVMSFHEAGEGQGEGKNCGFVPHYGSAVEVLDGLWCLYIANIYIYDS